MIRTRLTPEERGAVLGLRHDPTLTPPERDRVEMVLLSDAGWSPPAIATHLCYCPASVRRILRQFQHSGTAGLYRRHPGPPADMARRQKVETALKALLSQQRTWTASQLADALRKEDILLSTRQTRRYLRRMDSNWSRIGRTLGHKQDPKKAARAKRTLSVLKKKPPQGR